MCVIVHPHQILLSLVSHTPIHFQVLKDLCMSLHTLELLVGSFIQHMLSVLIGSIELNYTSPWNFRKLGQKGAPRGFQRLKKRFHKTHSKKAVMECHQSYPVWKPEVREIMPSEENHFLPRIPYPNDQNKTNMTRESNIFRNAEFPKKGSASSSLSESCWRMRSTKTGEEA